MMHQMSLNKPDRFNQIVGMCRGLFPEIGIILQPWLEMTYIQLQLKRKICPSQGHLKNEGTRLDQLLIINMESCYGEARKYFVFYR